ncbi:MAG: hypothetical protein V3R66_05485 [Rhodospirillales bacterium]
MSLRKDFKGLAKNIMEEFKHSTSLAKKAEKQAKKIKKLQKALKKLKKKSKGK